MIEKVNPAHPDKIADRIAGATVDIAYKYEANPKIATEVLIGHGVCHVIIETSVNIPKIEIESAIKRITMDNSIVCNIVIVKQDIHLAENQKKNIRCGDNGIFKGIPLTAEDKRMSEFARKIYYKYSYDGKYILNNKEFIVCQSNVDNKELEDYILPFATHIDYLTINPLGEWTGGTNVDTGATNRKLGSDMAQSVTGGGLHGKDLSKADVSVNIYAFRKAQETGKKVELSCAIGDEKIDGKPYSQIVEEARKYINNMGGFEKFAEWGLF